MKILFNALIIFSSLFVIFVSCTGDDDLSSDRSMPTNLTAENKGIYVLLSWKQKEENIDSFLIEKSRDNIIWNSLCHVGATYNQYNDSTIELDSSYYRISAISGNKQSNYCFTSIDIACFCDQNRFGTFTDKRDGNIYKTIKIGTQTWMAENLTYLPGVVTSRTYSDTIPYYYIYDYDGINVNAAKETYSYKTYGVLYNWSAAQSACPEGWHLPSIEEWETLNIYLASTGYSSNGIVYNENDHIYKRISSLNIAKSLATPYDWSQSDVSGNVGNEILKNNNTCFSAMACGYLYISKSPGSDVSKRGYFGYAGQSVIWWSSTFKMVDSGKYSKNAAYNRGLHSNSSILAHSYNNKNDGFYIRCVKD